MDIYTCDSVDCAAAGGWGRGCRAAGPCHRLLPQHGICHGRVSQPNVVAAARSPLRCAADSRRCASAAGRSARRSWTRRSPTRTRSRSCSWSASTPSWRPSSSARSSTVTSTRLSRTSCAAHDTFVVRRCRVGDIHHLHCGRLLHHTQRGVTQAALLLPNHRDTIINRCSCWVDNSAMMMATDDR